MNGKVRVYGRMVDSVATYSCDNGHLLDGGDSTRICQRHGWLMVGYSSNLYRYINLYSVYTNNSTCTVYILIIQPVQCIY